MEVFEAVKTRLETREFEKRQVSAEAKRDILEAARLAPSAMNVQRWRFVLLDRPEDLKKLAEISTTGRWIAGADFAIVVLTDPEDRYGLFDAAKAITHMQLVAWSRGIGSAHYTGYDEAKMKALINVPTGLTVVAVLGFGYPARKVVGKKNRLPIDEIAFHEKFGQPIGAL